MKKKTEAGIFLKISFFKDSVLSVGALKWRSQLQIV